MEREKMVVSAMKCLLLAPRARPDISRHGATGYEEHGPLAPTQPLPQAQLAVIGGSGFYEMDALRDLEQWAPETPYGAPSAPITIGTLHGKRVAFLPRHGVGHTLTPSEIPVRANMWALKSLGVQGIFAVSAVGSLKEEIVPLHMVVPDQIIDRTLSDRPVSFFGGGIVAHVGFAEAVDVIASLLGQQR